jgi:hypothetical protein
MRTPPPTPVSPESKPTPPPGEQGEGKARRRHGILQRFAIEDEWKGANEKQRAQKIIEHAGRQSDAAAKQRRRNRCQRQRPEQLPGEIPSPVKSQRNDRRDQDVKNERSRFYGSGRESEQRHCGDVSRSSSLTDTRVENRNDEERGAEEGKSELTQNGVYCGPIERSASVI